MSYGPKRQTGVGADAQATSPVIEFTDRATRDAFSRAVIRALLEFAPAAFEREEA